MSEFFTYSVYFAVALSIGAYLLASVINKKWHVALTTPLLLSTVMIIGFLVLFNIPYAEYREGASYLFYFLTPATVCFAVPMYKRIKMLGRYRAAVIASTIVGCAVSVGTVVFLSWAFGLGDIIMKSMAAVSVTTAIAIGITEELGGIAALTVFSVIITGIIGNAIGKQICQFLGLKSPVARGLAIGNASHAMGTAKALEMGPTEGASASIAIVISGLATAALAPLIIWLFA